MVSRLTLTDVDIAKVLLTMAEHQQRMADPAYSKTLREDILTLPEELQKKVAAAQEIAAKGDSLKAEIRKQQDEANAQLAERERLVKFREATVEQQKNLKSEAEAAIAKANAVKEENKQKELALSAIAENHKKIENGHKIKEAEIAKREKDAGEWEKRLDQREKDIFAYEKRINETAEEVQGLIKSKIRK